MDDKDLNGADPLREALKNALPLLETLHSVTPRGDARNIIWRVVLEMRVALSASSVIDR